MTLESNIVYIKILTDKEKTLSTDLDGMTDVTFIAYYRNCKLEMISMKHKFNLIHALTGRIAYECMDTGRVRDTSYLGKETEDLVWMWVDGLYNKWYFNCMDGMCSLKASQDFDMIEEEAKMDKWIVQFYEIYDNLK